MSQIQVAIMIGSKSDLSTMQETADILTSMGVDYEMKVLSAHRTPSETAEYAAALKDRGIRVVICGAGGSAALAGVVAAHTPLPVIGVPVESVLQGLDSLLSIVQMPPGVPVAGVAIGKAGAKNAALLAVRILALNDKKLEAQLQEYKDTQRQKILNEKV